MEILHVIKNDLEYLDEILRGALPGSNHSRDLFASILKTEVPNNWKFRENTLTNINEYIFDFASRLEEVLSLARVDSFDGFGFNLSKMFDPAAFITATRQYAAKADNLSLEKMRVNLTLAEPKSETYFKISGLKLAGASIISSKLVLSDNVELNNIDTCYIHWTEDISRSSLHIPVYSNLQRNRVLFYYDCEVDEPSQFIMRSVAMLC